MRLLWQARINKLDKIILRFHPIKLSSSAFLNNCILKKSKCLNWKNSPTSLFYIYSCVFYQIISHREAVFIRTVHNTQETPNSISRIYDVRSFGCN